MKKNIIAKGAEAILVKKSFMGIEVVEKIRIKKSYRPPALDRRLRRDRTEREAYLLHLAKKAGIKTPIVFMVKKYSIVMSYIEGKKPKAEEVWEEMSSNLALLHKHHIVHNDFTTANILKKDTSIYVIDFGLGKYTTRIEDKAEDLYTFLNSLPKELKEKALNTYKKIYPNDQIIEKLEDIRKRMRYVVG